MRNEKELKKRAKEIINCKKCTLYKYSEKSPLGRLPFEGKHDYIMIIGINPTELKEGKEELKRTTYENIKPYYDYMKKRFEKYKLPKYFSDFEHLFGKNYKLYLKKYVFCTELVKCRTKVRWRELDQDVQTKAIQSCGKYLKKQIEIVKPNLIICNGNPVCKWFNNNYDIQGNKIQIAGTKANIIRSSFISYLNPTKKKELQKEVKPFLPKL